MPQPSALDVIPRLVATTLPYYVRKAEDETLRKHKLTALLMKRTKFNCHGRFIEWPIWYNTGNVITRSPGEAVIWTPVDRVKTFSLPWAQYMTTDKYTEEENDRNSGAAAIINYYEELPKRVSNDLLQHIGFAIFANGAAAGVSNQLFGLETAFGTTGSAIVGTAVMNPSATYAGQSTVLGAGGGTDPAAATPWPIAQVIPAYDYNSPLILDATSTLVKTASNFAWANTGGFEQRNEEIMSFAVTYSRRNAMGTDAELTLFLLNTQWYHYFKMTNRAKERVQVIRGQGESLTHFGFGDVMYFDGAEVTSDQAVGAGVGYGLNLNQMQMCAEKDRLIQVTGPEWDPYSKSWLLDARLRGQMTMNVRHAVKIGEYASAGV